MADGTVDGGPPVESSLQSKQQTPLHVIAEAVTQQAGSALPSSVLLAQHAVLREITVSVQSELNKREQQDRERDKPAQNAYCTHHPTCENNPLHGLMFSRSSVT